VERDDDVGGVADAAQDVVGLVGAHAGAGWDDLHLPGRDGLGREEVFPDDAKTGDDGRTGRSVHEYGHAAFGMGRSVDQAQAGHDFGVAGQRFYLAGLHHVLDIFLVVAVIEGVRVRGVDQFPFVDVEDGVFAQPVVFAVVVVQMRVEDDVDVGRRKAELGEPFGKAMNGAADGLFTRLGEHGAHFAGIDQDAFVPAFQIPAVDGNGVGFAVVELVGHHALVEFLGAKDQGMDHEGGHA